jgi:L-threonylcarbamoyladenylate synthase
VPVILDPTPENIAKCAERLRWGLPVAFPTETVYGLACDARSEAAVSEVYRMKRRPSSNPLIAHVSGVAMAKEAVIGWDKRADKLAEAFWPGPLAMIFNRRSSISALSVGGRTSVAVRSPAHAVAQALIAAFGHPIAAPSANRSGRISPTTAAHVAEEFADVADLPILDGGACEVGLESTVLDLSRARPMILRPGAISAKDLEPILGPVAAPMIGSQAGSPGTAASHYAPVKMTELVLASDLAARLARETAAVAVVAFAGTPIAAPHELFALPRHAASYAQLLYATLRRADASAATSIFIVLPDETGGIWDAAHDRIRRAAAKRPAPTT